MKLVTHYNRYIITAVVLLLFLSSVISFFLYQRILQDEVDKSVLRTRERIENYVAVNKRLPDIYMFGDQNIYFEKLTAPVKDTGFKSATQTMSLLKKNHIARALVFNVEINHVFYKGYISQPLEGTRRLTKLIVAIAIATTVFILLVFLIINRLVLSKIWRPFYVSLETVKAFKVNEERGIFFPSSSVDEFNQLNRHLTMVTQNASRDYRNLKEFSENASHEMQTPLAGIRSNLDMLLQLDGITEKHSELILLTYSSISRLSKLQHSLLLLTKIDNNQFCDTEAVDLAAVLHQKIAQYAEFWQSRNITCVESVESIKVNINRELLDIMLNNLLGNAIRHNTSGGCIYIAAGSHLLEIANTGMERSLDKSRLYQRFYKEGTDADSNGLGLSIVKQICDASGIVISYHFRDGLHVFTLQFNAV